MSQNIENGKKQATINYANERRGERLVAKWMLCHRYPRLTRKWAWFQKITPDWDKCTSEKLSSIHSMQTHRCIHPTHTHLPHTSVGSEPASLLKEGW